MAQHKFVSVFVIERAQHREEPAKKRRETTTDLFYSHNFDFGEISDAIFLDRFCLKIVYGNLISMILYFCIGDCCGKKKRDRRSGQKHRLCLAARWYEECGMLPIG